MAWRQTSDKLLPEQIIHPFHYHIHVSGGYNALNGIFIQYFDISKLRPIGISDKYVQFKSFYAFCFVEICSFSSRISIDYNKFRHRNIAYVTEPQTQEVSKCSLSTNDDNKQRVHSVETPVW